MPTSPHRRGQRDASAKRRRSWVQRASEAPDGQTTTYPGTMPVAFARNARLLAIAFLQVQLDFWDAAGPHDSEPQSQVLREAQRGFAKTLSPAKIPSWRRSEREPERLRCGWRCVQRTHRSGAEGGDAALPSSQGPERRFGKAPTFAGATGIGGAGW